MYDDDSDEEGKVSQTSSAPASVVCHLCFAWSLSTCSLCCPTLCFHTSVCMLRLSKSWFYLDAFLPNTQGLSLLEASDVSRLYFKDASGSLLRELRSTSSTRSLKIPRKWWCLDDIGREIWEWEES